MNLLSMLTGTMTSDASVASLSEKTGVSSGKISQLIKLALPLLLGKMTQNASQGDGAASLLSALSQHTEKRAIADQFASADAEDGSKILGHIFGGDTGSLFSSLGQQTGLSDSDVSSVLSNLAPGLLSGLSAATQEGSAAGSSASAAQTGSASGGLTLLEEPAASGTTASPLQQIFGLQSTAGSTGAGTAADAQPESAGTSSGGFLGLLSGLFGSAGSNTSGAAESDAAESGLSQSGLLSSFGNAEDTASYDGSNLLQSLMSLLN